MSDSDVSDAFDDMDEENTTGCGSEDIKKETIFQEHMFKPPYSTEIWREPYALRKRASVAILMPWALERIQYQITLKS